MTCEDCKYVLIHYDKHGKMTLRCYYDFMKSIEYEKVAPYTMVVDICEKFEKDSLPIETRIYRAKTKEADNECIR
jgi:hypothetical protein